MSAITDDAMVVEQETGVKFCNAEEGGFDGITEETDFYLNEAGDPVVVFAPMRLHREQQEPWNL